MISKFKNSQLVFIDGEIPAIIKRLFIDDGQFMYEMRGNGDIFPESRLSLLKS